MRASVDIDDRSEPYAACAMHFETRMRTALGVLRGRFPPGRQKCISACTWPYGYCPFHCHRSPEVDGGSGTV